MDLPLAPHPFTALPYDRLPREFAKLSKDGLANGQVPILIEIDEVVSELCGNLHHGGLLVEIIGSPQFFNHPFGYIGGYRHGCL